YRFFCFEYFAAPKNSLSQKPPAIGLTPFKPVKVHHLSTSHNKCKKAKSQATAYRGLDTWIQ
ncbi:MAG: hypothetical protein J7L34_00745, partial [Thermotogaceae bacterium]|nr:hypothetical protein [Thermotogaceae bacterium]